MTKETDELANQINEIKRQHEDEQRPHPTEEGWSTTINVLTDLLGCVLIGLGLGVFLQSVFNTSVLVTASLTILGGIAGLWTVIRYALSLEKRGNKDK